MRTSTYTTNYQNELTQRTVPSYKEIQGTANASATVTVNGASVYRKGEFFRYELPVSNGSYGSYTPATVTSTISGLSDSSSGDIFTHPSNDVGNYDADGNLIYDGRWTYTWNAENRLVAMEENFTAWPNQSKRRRLEFVYDGNGRRIEKKVYQFNTSTYAFSDHIGSWIYVYDGWNLITETKRAPGNGSTHRTYVWGPDLSGSAQGAGGVGGLLMVTDRTGASDKHHYVGYDGNGNVAVLVDADTGTISGRYEYGPFGEPLRASGQSIAAENPFRFSTKFTDKESGYLYYGFRYYNPETGRWLNRDPIEEEGGINLYCFINNVGPNGWDKLGKDGPFNSGEHKMFDGLQLPHDPLFDDAKEWLGKCHPELICPSVLMHLPDGLAGITIPSYPFPIIVVSPGDTIEGYIDTLAHEGIHCNQGLALTDAVHSDFFIAADEIAREYRRDPTGENCKCSGDHYGATKEPINTWIFETLFGSDTGIFLWHNLY